MQESIRMAENKKMWDIQTILPSPLHGLSRMLMRTRGAQGTEDTSVGGASVEEGKVCNGRKGTNTSGEAFPSVIKS